MKLYSFSNGKGVSFAIAGNAPVLQAWDFRGKKRLKLVSVRPIKKDQWLIYVPKPLRGRHIVGNTWVKSPEITIIGEDKGIRIFHIGLNREYA